MDVANSGAPLSRETVRQEEDRSRSSMCGVGRAIVAGPILPTILRLAAPTIAVLVAQTMVGILETFYVSFLGTAALVGVSIVFPIWMLMTMTSAGGLGGGVASAVARAIGSGRAQDADDLVLHAVVLAVTIGASFMFGVWLFGPELLRALGATDASLTQAITYSNWLFLGAIPIWLVNLCSAALRGAGNVRTPALVSLFGVLVLVPLSPLLIFGWGPVEGFGVAGAGMAVAAYNAAAAVALLMHLRTGRAGLTLRLAPLRWDLFRSVLSVGIISSISAIQLNLAVILVTAVVGSFGTSVLAGFGIASRLDYVFLPVLFGLGSAVLTMVGTCIGSGDLARAKRIALTGTALGAGFTGAIGVALAFFPETWMKIFSGDPDVIRTGTTYLQIVAPVYVAMGVSFVLSFASQGAGRPLWTMLAGTLRVAIAAGGGWAAMSVWQASFDIAAAFVAAGLAGSALLCVFAYRSGRFWPTEPSFNQRREV